MSYANGYVTTIRERCRMCYTCIRECPAKAIRVKDGQAEVIPERCIACGNCVRVCSQQAKQYPDSVGEVERLLAADRKVIACVAPSFPAEFHEIGEGVLVGMIRELGFDYVCEVSFGADLVAKRYRAVVESAEERRFIATSCPAVVCYIERFYPHLVSSLLPIVSPMVASARAVRRIHGKTSPSSSSAPVWARKWKRIRRTFARRHQRGAHLRRAASHVR